MPGISRSKHCLLAVLIVIFTAGTGGAFAADGEENTPRKESGTSHEKAASPAKPKLDRSGRKRVGKASYYSKKFAGKKMADGARMKPHSDNAASKTLPLGTTARVTNLETGQSAVITIQDRGPHVKGRIVDLSPATAEKIGINRQDGVAKVEVAPVAVPQADGSIKPGAAAEEGKRGDATSNR
ncbi:MAG: septal ring lytic transglycosylase RlpA family protein [Betaproteobacteria bacterium]